MAELEPLAGMVSPGLAAGRQRRRGQQRPGRRDLQRHVRHTDHRSQAGCPQGLPAAKATDTITANQATAGWAGRAVREVPPSVAVGGAPGGTCTVRPTRAPRESPESRVWASAAASIFSRLVR